MIRASKRNYKRKPITLEVHKSLSSQRYWNHRLMMCSIGALLGSLIGWMFSLSLAMHWVLMLIGFLMGFFIPVASTLPWAMAWIRERVGLSYEAALESQPDPYGFHQKLQERAKTQLRQLELPTLQAWWLPIMIAAISLTLFPLIPKVITTFSAGRDTNPSTSDTPGPNEAITPQSPPESGQSSTATPPEEANTPQTTSEAQDLEAELSQSSNTANRDNQVADEEALSRFLEELQQKGKQSETNNISPQLQPGQSTNSEDGDNASSIEDEQTNPFENITEPREGEASNEPGQTQSEQQQNQPSQQENQTESTDLEQSQGSSQENSEPQSQENNASGSKTQGQEKGDQALRDEGEGEGAGVLGSEPGETPGSGLEGESQQAPELLEGQILPGPQNVAGTVRLPNSPDEVAPPSNTIAPSFRPSDEEALTEGKIPLEYQNIIRNYFRY
jgi:hypothetical protein